jgi:hypothetical protein
MVKCAECDDDGIVGWGAPRNVVWLCLKHFEERLAEAGRIIKKFIGGVTTP